MMVVTFEDDGDFDDGHDDFDDGYDDFDDEYDDEDITGQYGATFSHKISPWSCMVLELYLVAKHNTYSSRV